MPITLSAADLRWLAVAAALGERARPLSSPNPGVGAILVKHGVVIGRGWTQPGGRPHAEAVALAQAGAAARGATLYVSLEPCAHQSARGPSCASGAVAAGISRVVAGIADPDPRTAGKGLGLIRAAGAEALCADDAACRESLSGYLHQKKLGRPEITLKLAVSLDGRIALPNGASQWITGPESRAHVHRERARADAIVVGGGTYRADGPQLDVRLPGLERRSPTRMILSRTPPPAGWQHLPTPEAVFALPHVQYLFVEGGAGAAAAFLQRDLVDRLLLYRAPILIGDGVPALQNIGLQSLQDAHDRWHQTGSAILGKDRLEIFRRAR